MTHRVSVQPDDDLSNQMAAKSEYLYLTAWMLCDTAVMREDKASYYAKRIAEIMSSPEEDD